MTKSKKPGMRAFIVALANQNLDTLKEELARRGIDVFTAYDLTPATSSLITDIERAIKDADIVIAVVPELPSPNVFFELGLAHASRKPVLLLISPKYGHLPSDLESTFYLRANPENSEAIGFALDQCAPRLERPAFRLRKPPKEGRPLGDDADRFLARIRQAGNKLSGHELESLVAEVLHAAGVKAVSQSPRPDMGADIAVWSDALQSVAGNPLLIEVKSRLQSRRQMRDAFDRVEQYRLRSGARLALLVVNGVTEALSASLPATIMPAMVGGVLAIILSDLLERLRNKTFAEAIRELRNQSVHGGRK